MFNNLNCFVKCVKHSEDYKVNACARTESCSSKRCRRCLHLTEVTQAVPTTADERQESLFNGKGGKRSTSITHY